MDMDPEDIQYYEDLMYTIISPHPLLLPTIIRSILMDFSHVELKRYRLVCASWEYEISDMIRGKTQVRFPSEKSVDRYLCELSENFCCESYEFGPDIPLTCSVMNDFFDTFGEEVKALKLHQINWKGPELWSTLCKLPALQELSIRIFIPYESTFLPYEGATLPSIKKLKLNFSIDKPFKANPPPPPEITHPSILREILSAVPNIQEIYCPSWPTYIRPDKCVNELFYNVIFEYPDIQFKQLSYIYINAPLDNVQIYKLMDKNFPLKELRLELYPDVKPYFFYFLLKNLEQTLRSLILIFHADYDAENFDGFPILKNLNYLSLHKYWGPVDVIVRYLPNLRSLLLNDSYITDDSVEYPRFMRNPLEELVVEGITYNPYEQLNVVARNFPNLKKLKIQHVDDMMLRLIFIKLTNLEELVADGKFTDAGISGIPLDICQNIFDVPDVDKVRKFPYIGRLTKLRSLVLSSWAMSYLSILLGVNDCKRLKYKRISSPQIRASQ